MENSIPAVCKIIDSEFGLTFLQYMRNIHLGRELVTLSEGNLRKSATLGQELGLLNSDPNNLSLSPIGFLVGNVAKEYCNWLDYNRKMPPPRPPEDFLAGKDILDLGCGPGRWLWEFQSVSRSATGLELRREYADLGQALARREKIPPPMIVQGCIEKIDHLFVPQSMDFIFCRLAINHVAIRSTLEKIIALLRPGGIVWLEVESLRCGWNKFMAARGLKERIFADFGLLNSLLCELTSRQMNLRFHGFHQSAHKVAYPSRHWWTAIFARLGMKAVLVDPATGPFCVWGRKS